MSFYTRLYNYHYISSNLHQQFCIRRWSKAWSHRNKAFALQGTTRYRWNLYSDHHEMLFSRRYRSNAVSTCSDYGKGTIMTSILKIIPIILLSHVMVTWSFVYIIVLWKHLRRGRFIWLSSSARFWSIPLCWSMWVSRWAGWIRKLSRLWGLW